MARPTTCPDCKTEISPKATTCPKCGKSTRPKKSIGLVKWCAIAFSLFAFASLLRQDKDHRPPGASPRPIEPSVPPDPGPLPAYTVLDTGPIFHDGSRTGERADILVPSLRPDSGPEAVERACRSIAKEMGFAEASFYGHEDGYKANTSASFLKDHPDSMGKWYLGRLDEGGKWSPP